MGEVDLLRERMIGVEMFHRPVDYDTANDSVVRVKATEVRKMLSRYYHEHEKTGIRIDLASGTYVPKFIFERTETSVSVPSQATKDAALLPPAGTIQEPPTGDIEGVSSHVPPAREGRTGRLTLLVGTVLGVCVLAGATFVGFRIWRPSSSPEPAIRSIAVLPFENASGDPRQDYFADGITGELIADLGRVSSLKVISRTSSMSYKGTRKSLPEIARELSVDGVVEGSVRRNGTEVRITAELVDARSDHSVWSRSYKRDLTNVLLLQDEIAQALADEVSLKVTPNQQPYPAQLGPVNVKAEDLYLQGMLHMDVNNSAVALRDFQQAVQTDPNFAQAHAALASCYGRAGEGGFLDYGEAFSKQRAEAMRAIELDPSLPEGHAELANAAMNLNWDWETAATEFRKALALNPSLATTHERYAVYLERKGKMSEAIVEARRGLELDPLSTFSLINVAYTYYLCRRYDEVFAIIRKYPQLQDEHFLFGEVFAAKGMYAKSIDEFLKSDDSPHSLGHLGNAYARAGNASEARKIILKLIQNVQKGGIGAYEIALVYAGLGEKDDAFAWLEKAYNSHSEGLTYLKIDPCLDPLRADPRFADLLRKTGLTS